MKNYTDITILLDRSGSMDSIKPAMESGFNEFIQEHKANPSTRMTLIQFDTPEPEVVYENTPILDVPKFTLQPRGMTALFDALCKTIDRTGRRLADMKQSERPERVLFVIITDGQENASVTYRRTDVRERISRQTGVYNWQFTYLGANQDAYKEAESFGIAAGSTMNYTASMAGTRGAMRGMAVTTSNYAGGLTGQSLGNFTKEQLDAALDEDPKPTTK